MMRHRHRREPGRAHREYHVQVASWLRTAGGGDAEACADGPVASQSFSSALSFLSTTTKHERRNPRTKSRNRAVREKTREKGCVPLIKHHTLHSPHPPRRLLPVHDLHDPRRPSFLAPRGAVLCVCPGFFPACYVSCPTSPTPTCSCSCSCSSKAVSMRTSSSPAKM